MISVFNSVAILQDIAASQSKPRNGFCVRRPFIRVQLFKLTPPVFNGLELILSHVSRILKFSVKRQQKAVGA